MRVLIVFDLNFDEPVVSVGVKYKTLCSRVFLVVFELIFGEPIFVSGREILNTLISENHTSFGLPLGHTRVARKRVPQATGQPRATGASLSLLLARATARTAFLQLDCDSLGQMFMI